MRLLYHSGRWHCPRDCGEGVGGLRTAARLAIAHVSGSVHPLLAAWYHSLANIVTGNKQITLRLTGPPNHNCCFKVLPEFKSFVIKSCCNLGGIREHSKLIQLTRLAIGARYAAAAFGGHVLWTEIRWPDRRFCPVQTNRAATSDAHSTGARRIFAAYFLETGTMRLVIGLCVPLFLLLDCSGASAQSLLPAPTACWNVLPHADRGWLVFFDSHSAELPREPEAC